MQSGGITEAIWHFAGYLHLTEETARAWELYEDQPPMRLTDGPSTHGVSVTKRPDDLPDDHSTPVRTAFNSEAKPLAEFFWSHSGDVHHGVWRADTKVSHHLNPIYAANQTIPAVSSASEYRAPVTREDGAGQTMLDLRQINVMQDDDIFINHANSGVSLQHDIDVAETFQAMFAAADDLVPAGLRLPDGGGSALIEFFTARADAHFSDPATREGSDAEHIVSAGRYVNGELMESEGGPQNDDPWGPDHGAPALPDMPVDGRSEPGHVAELGANSATNAAIVFDSMGVTLSMIVLGNYHVTNAIFQINMLLDRDEIHVGDDTGAQDGVTQKIVTGDNRLENIAEFHQGKLDVGVFGTPTGHAGMNWTIDIVNGDFIDVSLMTQNNVLIDNDIYSQTMYSEYSQVRMGGNEQINYAEFQNLAKFYDLIIVGGNYYKANWIEQKNFVIDDDIVTVVAGGNGSGGGGGGAQLIHTGQNSLVNDAYIANYAVEGSKPLQPGTQDFIDQLLHADHIAPQTWWDYSGIGSSNMNVLYVSGDFFDFNVVKQTNVIADLDFLIQMMPTDSAEGGEFTQIASTGGNSASNIAAIIDFGPAVEKFVGGEEYSEYILVNANIVVDEAEVVIHDTQTLVSELVAFTGGEGGDDEEPAHAPITFTEGDVMGGILT
jgi:hypothetical protein